MIQIRGFSANLSPTERMSVEDLQKFLAQFNNASVVMVVNRREVKLHGIRFSAANKQVQFLMKEVS